MMVALETAPRSRPGAHAARTALAAGLLVLGAGDLAVIHAVLLPRYLAARWHGPEASSTALAVGKQAAPAPVPAAPVSVPAAPPAPAPAEPKPTAAPPALAPAVAELRPQAEPTPAQVQAGERAPPEASPAGRSEWPDLLFIRNTAWLSPEACEALARLAERLNGNPSLLARLSGHTDDLGPPEVNRALSLRRATRAQTWLTKRGVNPDQIEVRGLGASQPAASGGSREARARNRRVEITVSERSP